MSPENGEGVMTHFSHTHPLHLSSSDQFTCACCNLTGSGDAYSCNTCDYVLDISCAQLPQLLTHPADSRHTLRLLTLPTYSNGSFCCNACYRSGTGFNYCCASCSIDLHVLCASLPLSMHLHDAHRHTLDLVFHTPNDKLPSRCDLCRHKIFDKSWRYRCDKCDFDAHVHCATERENPQQQQQQQQQQQVQSRAARSVGATGLDGTRRNIASSGSGHGGIRGGDVPPSLGAAAGSGLGTEAIKGIVHGTGQEVGRSVIHEVFRGGRGGNAGGSNNGNGSGGDGGGFDLDHLVDIFTSFFGS